MGKKNIAFCLLLIFSLFSIGFVSSQEVRFTGQQNTQLNIFEECEVNGFPCGATFSCNITSRDPNQTVLILNKQMTKNDTIYNYTINVNQTKILGKYEDTVFCTNGSVAGTNTFYHEITPSGAEPLGTGQGSTLIGILGVLIFAIIFFLVLGIFTKNIPFKVFFVGFAILLMVGTLGFGVTIMQQLFGTFASLVSSYGMFFRILIILSGAGAIGLILYLLVVAVRTFKIKRGLME
jgi:hypothetical protein